MPTYGTEEWESWWSSFNEKWDEDLFCHEDMFASDEEATADSQHSTPPKKKRKVEDPKNFPSDLHQFLSQAVFSNRTLACFAVYTTKEKAQILYKKHSLTEECMQIYRKVFRVFYLFFLLRWGRVLGSCVFIITGKHFFMAKQVFIPLLIKCIPPGFPFICSIGWHLKKNN